MKRALLACLFCVLAIGAARADASPTTILTPEDVATYNAIFAAQDNGDISRAEDLSGRLTDQSLMGYVLRDRYLSKHYHVTLDQLVAWMRKYQDLDGAERIYRLAMKSVRAVRMSPFPDRPA